MTDVYATGEVPAIGDVVARTSGTEYTVYACTGTAIYASAANGQTTSFNPATHIYTLVRRKGGAVDAPAGTVNVNELRTALEEAHAEIGSLTERIADHEETIADLREDKRRLSFLYDVAMQVSYVEPKMGARNRGPLPVAMQSKSAGSTTTEETVDAGGS